MEILHFEIQEDEFVNLKKGEVIDHHWHVDKLNPDYCLCVFVGKKQFSPDDFKELLEKGHGVAPITVDDQTIELLQHSDKAINFKYNTSFEIMIVSHRFRELEQERKS